MRIPGQICLSGKTLTMTTCASHAGIGIAGIAGIGIAGIAGIAGIGIAGIAQTLNSHCSVLTFGLR